MNDEDDRTPRRSALKVATLVVTVAGWFVVPALDELIRAVIGV